MTEYSDPTPRHRFLELKHTLLVAAVSLLISFLVACGGGGAADPPQPVRLEQASVSVTGNPLVAQYSVTTSGSGTVAVQFGPSQSYGFQTSAQSMPSDGGTTTILVAGMKQNTLYHMRAVISSAAGQVFDQDRTFQSGSIPPERIPATHVTIPAGQQPAPGVELLSLTGTNPNKLGSVALNPAGDVVWYYSYDPNAGTPMLTKLMPNGHMLVILNINGNPPSSAVREIDLAGNVVRQFDLPLIKQKLHDAGFNLNLISIDHDILVLPNGHLMFITGDSRVFTDLPGYPGQTTVIGNAIIEVDDNTNLVWVWDAFDHLDVNRHPINQYFPDWTHANALYYSPDDGNILLSLRHQHWVLKINYQNANGAGDILWKLGHDGDFTLLDSDSPADWFYAQHDANIVSAHSTGDFQLAVFDNGNYRVLDDNGDTCDPEQNPQQCYSNAAIYDVNETNRTARRLWSEQIPYSLWGGASRLLPNGNVFFNETAPWDLGLVSSRVHEVTQTANPTTIWTLEIDHQNAYRTVHMPSLYPGVQW